MEATAFRTEGGRRLTARSRGKIRFLSADEVIRVLHKGRKAFFYCRDGRLTEGVVFMDIPMYCHSVPSDDSTL